MSLEPIAEALRNLLSVVAGTLQQVPGLDLVVQYAQRSYQNDPFRVLLEALLIFFVLRYLLGKPQPKSDKLTEKEEARLIEEWQPEPLVPREASLLPVRGIGSAARGGGGKVTNMRGEEEENGLTNGIGEEEDQVVITGKAALNVKLKTGEELQNWSSANYLGLMNNPDITEVAINTVREYGVGTCGPCGFYGSLDVHLELEKELARIMDVEQAIVYAQGFMAVASVIPAFSKKGDVIVADRAVNAAIQTGLNVSRSRLYYFDHNDMEDLKRVMQDVEAEAKRNKWPLMRKFLVIEGLYAKMGTKPPLPEIMKIKETFKYRLIVDESHSFGCLGPHGLGISDYYGIPAKDIDIIAGSFSNVLGSSGGFCVGSRHVVEHQRLSSLAYCFSASLPALLTVSASQALKQIHARPELLQQLKVNVLALRAVLDRELPAYFRILGDRDSPLQHIQLAMRHEDRRSEVALIAEAVRELRTKGYLVAAAAHVEQFDKHPQPPSIRLGISAGFTVEETERFAHDLAVVLSTLR